MRLKSRITPIDAPTIVKKYNIPELDWSVNGDVDGTLRELGQVNIDLGTIHLYADSKIPEDNRKVKVYEEIRKQNLVPPTKMLTWGELKKHDLIDLEMGLEYEVETYLNMNYRGYTGGIHNQAGDTGLTDDELNSVGSTFYHSTKAHWMIHDIKENGLVNPVQGCIYAYSDGRSDTQRYRLHIHPGSIRQSMYKILDDDSLPILLADPYNYIESPELSVKEHLEIFADSSLQATELSLDYHNGYVQVWPTQLTPRLDSWRKRVTEFGKSVFELTEGKPFNIYIGYDSRHQQLPQLSRNSILRYLNGNKQHKMSDLECFKPEIKFIDKSKIPEYTREYAGQSTEFTYSRFLIPYLEDYKGISLFIDDDMIFSKSPLPLFMFLHPDDAVAVCKYDYDNLHTPETKFDGEKNVAYPKKLWSSMMVFNNSHEDCKKLTPEVINTASGKYLHQFEWTDMVSEIPTKYIHNEGYDDIKPDAFGFHYTRGGPWVKGQDCSDISNLKQYTIEKNCLERDGEINL